MSEWARVLSADTSMEARVQPTSEPLPGLVRAFRNEHDQTHSVALEHGGGTSMVCDGRFFILTPRCQQ